MNSQDMEEDLSLSIAHASECWGALNVGADDSFSTFITRLVGGTPFRNKALVILSGGFEFASC